MTVSDIYAKIAQHMIKGLMVHEQMAEYYDFLGLDGYRKCHEYHYLEENCAYRHLMRYYIGHYNMLIPELSVDNPKIIPSSWYKYTRQDVDNSTKKTAIKNGLQMWKDWETETKDLYEELYAELLKLEEIASASMLKDLICDVTEELAEVDKYCMHKKAIEYDLITIMAEQDSMHDKYSCMCEHL